MIIGVPTIEASTVSTKTTNRMVMGERSRPMNLFCKKVTGPQAAFLAHDQLTSHILHCF